MSCNNTNSTCTNCNHNYSSCNNKCAKCGCKDSFLTSPPPCPTPNGCPDPVPCQEVLSSDCVIYTGDPIMCDDIVIIPSDSTMTEALIALADFMCGCCGSPHTPITYKCLTGVCFDPGDGSGPYDTLAECNTYCTTPPQPSWNCVNNNCTDPGNGSGTYLSLSTCQASCPQVPPSYNCVSGNCVNPGDGTGMYGTLVQCQQFCEDVYESYDCLNGVCSDPGDGSGVYPTLVACDAACTFPPANISFNCLNGNCTDPGDGSGVYLTLLACQAACTFPPANISFNCFLGQCTDPGDGSGVYPTLLACQAACVPVPGVSYNCISGNCIDPGNGTGLYPTANACWVACDPTPPISPCVTTCEGLIIPAPLPGTTLVYSAYTITSTSSYIPDVMSLGPYLPLCGFSMNQPPWTNPALWPVWGITSPYTIASITPFTYTINFGSPINNVQIFLYGYTGFTTAWAGFPGHVEEFIFTTDAGFVDITCSDYCCATITNGNTVSAMTDPGVNCPPTTICNGNGICNGTGVFVISSTLSYTSLTITGTGGGVGTGIGLCESQFGTSYTSTIYTTFDALPIPAVSYNCVNCNCVPVVGPGGSFQTLNACKATGCENNKFVSTWETTTAGESITLPYYLGGVYTGTIDWGDGNTSVNSFATSTHIYATPGIYTITICGRTVGWNFSTTPASVLKIKSVVTWGQLELGQNLGAYFNGCTNLDLSAVTDTLDLFGTGITNFNNMFFGCTSLTTINNINFWDTSQITNMVAMFYGCTSFDQPLSFDTSAVTNMLSMFFGCTAFDSSVTFITIAVINMNQMFYNCSAFNQSITFSTAAVTNMANMFRNCTNFDSPVTFTSTSSVTDMSTMFFQCSNFNQPLTFNTSSVIDMSNMFVSCTSFDSPLTFTNTASVQNMTGMFLSCSIFNQPLTWDTSSVINMSGMFAGCTLFNGTLTFTSTANVQFMNIMFSSAPAFQQYIGSWDISSVTDFTGFMNSKTPATWPTIYFDNLLCGWSPQTVIPSLIIDFGSANYTNATGLACYTVLQAAPNLWTINSGGGV